MALFNYFDPIVLSSVYGRRKPDPAIFHYAARHGQRARQPVCLYWRPHCPRHCRARRAGYAKAIQIQHDFAHGEQDEGATPDAVIHEM